jgi:predicted nucleic acid-binding protein
MLWRLRPLIDAPILESLDSYPVLALTEAVFWAALQIKGRYQLSCWDSAIIAAALELDAERQGRPASEFHQSEVHQDGFDRTGASISVPL